MKKLTVVALVLCLALMPMFALAEDDRTMSVLGTATLTVTPDLAILNVGYAGENADSTLAQQAAADAITAVVAAVKELGVAEADIVTAYLNTYPVYNYVDDGQTLRGYRVEHMLAVTVRDLDSVGTVLDAALKAGANQSNSIQYKSSKEKEVYLQALAMAIEDATEKADAMAVAAKVTLETLVEVNESASYSVYPYAKEAQYDSAAGASVGSTLMTGDLEVSASVELVYGIR